MTLQEAIDLVDAVAAETLAATTPDLVDDLVQSRIDGLVEAEATIRAGVPALIDGVLDAVTRDALEAMSRQVDALRMLVLLSLNPYALCPQDEAVTDADKRFRHERAVRVRETMELPPPAER